MNRTFLKILVMTCSLLQIFAAEDLLDECSTYCSNETDCENKAMSFPRGFLLRADLETRQYRPNLVEVTDDNEGYCARPLSKYRQEHSIRRLFVDTEILKNKIVTGSFSTHCHNKTVKGICPLFHALDNSIFNDCNLECLNDDQPAIEIKGTNVEISNVNVPLNKFLARAIDDYHIDVGNLKIEFSQGTVVLANIGAQSSVQVNCHPDDKFDTLVVTQRTGTTVTTSCSQVSLDAILNPLGTQYEIDYLFRNAEVNPLNEIFRWGLILYGILLGVLFLYTIVTREAQLRKLLLGYKFAEIKAALNAFS